MNNRERFQLQLDRLCGPAKYRPTVKSPKQQEREEAEQFWAELERRSQ